MSQDTFYDAVSAVIANGASLSGAYALNGEHLVGIAMPAAWTAAVMTFQGSVDGLTYQSCYDMSGNEITVQAGQALNHGIPPGALAGWKFLKIRSGTTAAPVSQGAARTVTMVARRYR